VALRYVGDTGYTQSFDESINKTAIIAEEKLLPRGVGAVVRLALPQFTSNIPNQGDLKMSITMQTGPDAAPPAIASFATRLLTLCTAASPI